MLLKEHKIKLWRGENEAEVNHEKHYSEDSLKNIASKKIKGETKLKETQEEGNALPHKSIFDMKFEKLANKNADPSEQVVSNLPLESSVKNDLNNEENYHEGSDI